MSILKYVNGDRRLSKTATPSRQIVSGLDLRVPLLKKCNLCTSEVGTHYIKVRDCLYNFEVDDDDDDDDDDKVYSSF
jgi:hypothetical protein